MIQLVNVPNQGSRYAKNLLSDESLISDNSVINFTSLPNITSGYELSKKDSFTGIAKAVKLSLSSVLQNIENVNFNFTNALKYTADANGNYIFSFGLKTDEDSIIQDFDFTLNLKVFKNGNLFLTIPIILNLTNFEAEKYYILAQSFDLEQDDLVDFAFNIEIPKISGFDAEICFDGFKLEKNIYNIGEYGMPSFYSLPISTATGWQSKTDTINTQNLTANTDNLIAFAGTNDFNVLNNLINSVGKITPISINDALNVDFVFSFPSPSGSGHFLNVKLKVNNVIYRAQSYSILAPTGETNYVSISFTLAVMQAFKDFGGELFVNPNNAITISNRYLQVSRTHKGQ
jgi:hypothetical protein